MVCNVGDYQLLFEFLVEEQILCDDLCVVLFLKVVVCIVDGWLNWFLLVVIFVGLVGSGKFYFVSIWWENVGVVSIDLVVGFDVVLQVVIYFVLLEDVDCWNFDDIEFFYVINFV